MPGRAPTPSRPSPPRWPRSPIGSTSPSPTSASNANSPPSPATETGAPARRWRSYPGQRMSNITVSLPDGSARELPADATPLDLAASIGSGLRKAAVAAVVDGEETDLTVPLSDGAEVAIITNNTDEGRHVLRHSTAHVLAQAVTQLYPGAKFSVGPAIENGFYYDFDLPDGQTFQESDLADIEKKMKEIVKANQPFIRSEHSMAEAKELFADQPYKVEIIERVETAGADELDAGEVSGDVISAYRNTDEFVDMCVGPHVPSTGKLPWFKLQKVAGAHWRGNESGKMLQR